jgi:hypothetical protein
MKPQISLILKPSRLWYIRSILWAEGLMFAVSLLGGILGELMFTSDPSLIYVLKQALMHVSLPAFMLLVFGTIGRARFSVTLSDGMIEGPSQKDNEKRIRFPVTHLDLTATGERSFWNKVIGIRILYSMDGEKIVLNEAVFPPAQVRALLQELNVTNG